MKKITLPKAGQLGKAETKPRTSPDRDRAPLPKEAVTIATDQLPYALQIAEVRRLYSIGEIDAALDLAGRLAADKPDLPRTAVPIVTMTSEALLALPLDHRAGFVLTRIDGNATLQGLIDVSAMDENEVLALVEKLVALGALALSVPDRTDATQGDDPPTVPRDGRGA